MSLAFKDPVRLSVDVLVILLAIMLRREVFPAPDGPRIAEISFDLHIPLTLLRMFLVEEFLFTFTYMSYYKFEKHISIFYFI